MPVESTKAMPSNTPRPETRGGPVGPCTAGGCGGINGSNSPRSSSLISRSGEDAGEDMLDNLRRTVGAEQGSTTYFCNVFLVAVTTGLSNTAVDLRIRLI